MKKKDIIYITIIIFLIITLITTIIYYNKNKTSTIEGEILVIGSNYLLVGTEDNEDYIINTKDTDYNIGDKIKIELTKINKKQTPYEGDAKNIILIEENLNSSDIDTENNEEEQKEENNTNNEMNNQIEETTNSSQITSNPSQNGEQKENISQDNEYTEQEVITYFEDLNNEVENYNNNDETIGKKIKSKFVKCIDFIFYDGEIGGKTFKELSNKTKLKILEISMNIDAKIDNKFPGYKESISSSYQNIKSKIIEKYLETTTNICNNEPDLCITAKEGFSNLKENFGLTWDLIKDLASGGVSKLKDWYEIWRYK